MLTRLSVRNLAIVESADVEFGEGLNVVTGETGAGKSVLMGALELVLGARADASAVRDGAKDARIEAEFQNPPATVAALLDETGLPACEEGTLLVRRTIAATGGGRVYVNDAATTVQTLRALGKLLVDVHGPNDHQSLLEEPFQRCVLDAYGRIDASAYQAAWTKLAELKSEQTRLQGDARDFAEEVERLRYSVDELEAAQLTDEDETELPARHAAAAHAAEILEDATAATAALCEADDSAASALIGAGARVREMAKFHPAAGEWSDEIERLTVQVQELSRTILDSVSRVEADPETLQALDERLSLVQRLKRKYACATVNDLLELSTARATRLSDLEGREGRLAALEAEIAAAEKDVTAVGKKLTAVRAKAAEKLAKAITKELHGLGFLKADFGVALVPHAPEASGCEAVDFQFAPNPGEPSRPLRDIASTGETARVMLAVKAVVAAHDATPVLVFDEIDSNIGGEVGRAVGEKLRTVAAHHQVVAITHLPQSAVYGDRHFAVAKAVSGGRTRSGVTELAGEARVAEIARMLGGTSLTSVVEQHARELLAKAERSSAKK
ncbi:MAG: DNA repair protein RecN [Kiritimatiellae bacterium]|nr:DNA repair protein RecN [Kiritimatiellia bacterium]